MAAASGPRQRGVARRVRAEGYDLGVRGQTSSCLHERPGLCVPGRGIYSFIRRTVSEAIRNHTWDRSAPNQKVCSFAGAILCRVEGRRVAGRGSVALPAAFAPGRSRAAGQEDQVLKHDGGRRFPRGRGGPRSPRGDVPTPARVPTRFVLKYTLRRRSEASGAHEAVEGGPGHAGDLGDGGLGDAQLEEAADLVLLAIEP